MKVTELNSTQLRQLKQDYIVELCNDENRPCMWGDLADVEKISDETIFEKYKGIDFSDEDFP